MLYIEAFSIQTFRHADIRFGCLHLLGGGVYNVGCHICLDVGETCSFTVVQSTCTVSGYFLFAACKGHNIFTTDSFLGGMRVESLEWV